jgi:hypothetical protein
MLRDIQQFLRQAVAPALHTTILRVDLRRRTSLARLMRQPRADRVNTIEALRHSTSATTNGSMKIATR